MSSTDPSEAPVRGKDRQARAIRRTAILCAVAFFGMVGAAFASVPLYRMFCQVTGFDGATRKGETGASQVLDQTLVVRFDANVRNLPWAFEPEQTSQTVRIGATNLAFYKVTNTSDRPITARATYNVVPEQAGVYFTKLECFCFRDQTLQPGQSMDFPVVYFIDPRYASDFETKSKAEVTLSYTFFPSVEADKTASNGAAGLGGTTKARL
jgi:cytochrome c oxidase assembly protein subunit 11